MSSSDMDRRTESLSMTDGSIPATVPPTVSSDPSDGRIKAYDKRNDWYYVQYDPARAAQYLPAMRKMISGDLSEPYSIYVYYYFLHGWPDLCFLCLSPEGQLLGVIINKLEPHVPPSRMGYPEEEVGKPKQRGYVAMIATDVKHRKRGIAKTLVRMAVEAMAAKGADEIALETEVDNEASLRLYLGLGFLKTKRLHRYYLNGNQAFRLLLNVDKGETEDKQTSKDGPAADEGENTKESG